MSSSFNDIEVFLSSTSSCHWINAKKLESLWTLSNIDKTVKYTSDESRMKNMSWRLWHYQQQQKQQQQQQQQQETTYTISSSCSNKFFFDMSDEEEEDVEEEEVEEEQQDEDCCSATWSFSSSEEDEWSNPQSDAEDELVFEKRIDDQNNSFYTTTRKIKQPISLLSQMLSGIEPPRMEKKQLLKRCQARYQSLNEWFTASS